MSNYIFTKKRLKYNLILKQIENLPFFFIVFSQTPQKNCLKLSNIFFIAYKELLFLKKQLLRTSSYITKTPLKNDKIVLLIKKNYCFFSDQIVSIDPKKTIIFFNQKFSLYKRFYLILKESSIKKK